jgi:hypothetical protein
MYYPWLIFNAGIAEARRGAERIERELNDIVRGIVIGNITVTSQKIRARNLSIVVEDLLSSPDRLDCLHYQRFLFLK